MTARMRVLVNGHEFVSKETDECNSGELSKEIYENIDCSGKLMIDTDNGSIIFHGNILENCILIFEDLDEIE